MASATVERGMGVDLAADQIADCRTRLAPLANLTFRTTSELGPPDQGRFDVVTCMETLEHCTDDGVNVALDQCRRLCTADGVFIVSVPIEIGPPLLVKQAVRRVAGWRRLGDYRWAERYPLGGLLRQCFATAATSFDRPIYGVPEAPHHSHFGFNWRRLAVRLRRDFEVQRILFSPFPALGPFANSQAWFVCRPHAVRAPGRPAP
jgi:SAM-dependent methyltransferase